MTLRCEGTVRGVGGISLVDDDCATGVPGLYAVGDAATRERVTGAISGGGGPNSSWAIASGNWAGRAAATFAFATRIGARAADRRVTPLGGAGLRPTGMAREDFDTEEIVRAVREEMLPLDRNFFRREVTLHRAAALTATSRWAYRSALARAESRGMHRRRDMPGAAPEFACSLHASGLDEVRVARAS